MFNMPTAMPSYPVVPASVQAAQQYLHFADSVRRQMPSFDGMRSSDERDLSAREQAVYDAALDVLRMYFHGEMDYEDAPPIPIGHGPPDDQEGPVPVMP